ncbi:Vms1/Ankzf1 family peptidyl-tRNA hydrolase [Rubrivirga sp. S365]|uniref:Vms1/Ankzf1 family peptidyl-tRNA hydrolase n=1 Tax=Rubrivirga litoralis TaxID=3075598 RepID=A0ABU3BNW1_9BACT|nr:MULTISPECIES: Vms1/Ankzf1 family peptidyl-tRNA hydrolase [unclassified Rubrivirga]MDT0630969.1 Vms1/Ankzf1 family peptidyl-tRNA hydrolase [Rubrivirga sp. F394]MDT7856612.1 Vms1/Ankzf1 family peptidyl-tRNA hydrolase [Rubrivirga sp. S365]
MTLDADHLRALSDLAGPERAFLTVYLDADDERSVLDERFARVRSLLADQPEETEHFEQNLAVVGKLLDGQSAPAGGAVVAFAGWAADLAKAYPLPEPVGTRVWMGDAPYVRPAYELLEEHETFAVAVVDNTSAKIYYVAPDEVDEEGSVRGDVKNRVKKGGWSQKRYARRREKQIEQYAAEIAGDLQALDHERPFSRLVLLGSDEPVRAVEEALATPLQDKLVGTRAVSADASEDQLLDTAAEVAEAGERQDEEDLWVAIREQGVGPGLAAFGATDVMEALRQARVEAVLVDREAEIAGTKCRTCEHVAHGTPDTCGVCGSSDVFRVDLVEAMTEQAVRTGAEVDFTDPFPALTDAGGVAALLRYSLDESHGEQEERERLERVERELAEREAAAPPAGDGAAAETAPPVDSETVPPAEPVTTEPVDVEPVAAEPPAPPVEPAPPVAEPTPPVAEPPVAEPAPEPQPAADRKRAADRAPAAPPAAEEAPATARKPAWAMLGWILLALLVIAVIVLLAVG